MLVSMGHLGHFGTHLGDFFGDIFWWILVPSQRQQNIWDKPAFGDHGDRQDLVCCFSSLRIINLGQFGSLVPLTWIGGEIACPINLLDLLNFGEGWTGDITSVGTGDCTGLGPLLESGASDGTCFC